MADQSSRPLGGYGNYAFTELACGVTHTFCEVLQSGWTQTFPNVVGGKVVSCAGVDQSVALSSLGYSETLVSGTPSVGNDFGNFSQLPPPVPLIDFRDVRRPNDIAIGPDLGGTGQEALNFTGNTGAAGDTWITVYDRNPPRGQPLSAASA